MCINSGRALVHHLVSDAFAPAPAQVKLYSLGELGQPTGPPQEKDPADPPQDQDHVRWLAARLLPLEILYLWNLHPAAPQQANKEQRTEQNPGTPLLLPRRAREDPGWLQNVV